MKAIINVQLIEILLQLIREQGFAIGSNLMFIKLKLSSQIFFKEFNNLATGGKPDSTFENFFLMQSLKALAELQYLILKPCILRIT